MTSKNLQVAQQQDVTSTNLPSGICHQQTFKIFREKFIFFNWAQLKQSAPPFATLLDFLTEHQIHFSRPIAKDVKNMSVERLKAHWPLLAQYYSTTCWWNVDGGVIGSVIFMIIIFTIKKAQIWIQLERLQLCPTQTYLSFILPYGYLIFNLYMISLLYLLAYRVCSNFSRDLLFIFSVRGRIDFHG